MKTGSKLSRWSLRLAGGCILLVLLAELTLRFGLGLGRPVLSTKDAACDYILKPDQKVYRFFCHTHTNHYGMRADNFEPNPAPGTERIFFIGDSVTYGTSHVDQAKIFTEVLHRELPGVIHKPVEVLNASVSGWAIDNEFSYLKSRGSFHSNLVILVINDGDLGQERAWISGAGEDIPTRNPSSALEEFWARYLKHKLFHAPVVKDAGDEANIKAKHQIALNLQEILDFRAEAQKDGSEFAILYIPFVGDLPTPNDKFRNILMPWSQEHGIPVCDMTDALSGYPHAKLTRDGAHLTPFGHTLVAERVEALWPQTIK